MSELVDRNFQAAEGMDVIGADGEKVGKVIAVRPSHIVVEKGFFFPMDYYIPRSAIVRQDEHVHLRVTKADALNQGWGHDPGEIGSSNPRLASAGGETAAETAGGTSIPTGGGSQWLGDTASGAAGQSGGTSIPGHGGDDWLGGDSGDGADLSRGIGANDTRPVD